VYKAIDALTGVKVDLESYGLESVNSGIDAMATTKVLIKPRIGTQLESAAVHSQSGATTNKRFSGSGSDTDIVVSSARAYIAAVNKLLNWNMHRYSSNLKAISGDFRASSA
jgi:2-isopropylmalate synthase